MADRLVPSHEDLPGLDPKSRALRTLMLASASVAVAFAATVIGLDHYGKGRRVMGTATAMTSRPPVVVVASAEEAFREWRARGFHGRVLVSASSRLYFVRKPDPSPIGTPLEERMLNPAVRIERDLSPQSVLLAALESGIAREIVHLLPVAAYEAKAAGLRGMEGVRTGEGRIDAPYFGTPRILTSIGAHVTLREPVLLFVSASAFREHDAPGLLEALAGTGMTTDLVVLCESRDDPEVTDVQRARLGSFARLVGLQ